MCEKTQIGVWILCVSRSYCILILSCCSVSLPSNSDTSLLRSRPGKMSSLFFRVLNYTVMLQMHCLSFSVTVQDRFDVFSNSARTFDVS